MTAQKISGRIHFRSFKFTMNFNLFWSYSIERESVGERERDLARSHASSDKYLPNKYPHKLTIHLIARRKEKPCSLLKMEETGVNVSEWSRYSSTHSLILLTAFSPPPSRFCGFWIKQQLMYPSTKLSCSGGAPQAPPLCVRACTGSCRKREDRNGKSPV